MKVIQTMPKSAKAKFKIPESESESESETKTKSETESENVEIIDKFIPKHPYREKIYNKFLSLLQKYNSNGLLLIDLQKMALNIERGCFNQTLSQTILCDREAWNTNFQTKYSSKVVKIYTNLNPESYLKNTDLIKRLFKKEFTEFEMITFTPEQMFPERFSQIKKHYDDLQPKLVTVKEEIPDGLFSCGRCKSKKTTYYQLQTRSADEPENGLKSILPVTYWLCYWKNSCNPIAILFMNFVKFRC
jgi:DNA-directed RNA polymerase subunit M/transcription elongation factor TFIIS